VQNWTPLSNKQQTEHVFGARYAAQQLQLASTGRRLGPRWRDIPLRKYISGKQPSIYLQTFSMCSVACSVLMLISNADAQEMCGTPAMWRSHSKCRDPPTQEVDN
jgi:hypothetical protein